MMDMDSDMDMDEAGAEADPDESPESLIDEGGADSGRCQL